MTAFGAQSGSRSIATMLVVLLACVAACGAPAGRAAGRTSADTVTDESVEVSDRDDAESGSTASADAFSALEAARRRWEDAGLGDHTLIVEEACNGCDPDDIGTGQVVSWGGGTYTSGPALNVDGLFSRIEAAIGDGRDVVVSYDDETGYPADVLIGPAAGEVVSGTHIIIHDVQEGLPGDEVSSSSFEEAMKRWETTRPHAYEYVVTVACGGCPFEGRLYTRVAGDAVVEDRFDSAGNESVSGLTIDELFRDLSDLFASDGGLVDGGVLINGTAEYDPTFGFPNWIGLDLEIVEPQEWNRDLPPRLVYMINRFSPLVMDEYCAAVDTLFSFNPDGRPDARYLRQLQSLQGLAPTEHVTLWELLHTLADEPFDYANFNPAADALDETAASLVETCPALQTFVMDSDGYVTYLR